MVRAVVAAACVATSAAFAPIVNVVAPVAAPIVASAPAVPAELVSTANSLLVATNEQDFGGYFFPVAGLTLLAALIAFLAPPISE
mmetsp:Transcript_5162/g.15318  ORF Transcript_5162/g.15318 Transcript_5162/m.15318 type:complete len:85 (+) Transcript_5162:67-321(+)|eukprot:CAMPEP_0119259872 /NCGR_PEP_ID=MMETSP1329-20130426/515_1 /TAXON_ID=114041 /ORGANISM="Genus nov. species nov., Strain RCC1024" /LENGTH=84 /DNA_ID=CAMNT_0007259279 /DNA_START=48 /DNA_END=302 /DNA_ORIENTATION=+